MSVISGTAYWASIQSPNTKFEPHRWSINVGNLDAENKAIAEKDGLTVKNKGDEKGDFVTIERKTTKKVLENPNEPNGPKITVDNEKPEVVDAQKKPMTDLVANGSKVNVLYQPYTWKNTFGTGRSADLKKVQVIELIPYNKEDDFDVVPDGYSSDKSGDEKIPFAS